MIKAALYCRLSEEDRDKRHITDDSASIQNQKAMLRSYAAEQGWEVFDIYSDDDYAGSDRSRPEFCRLLRDAEQRRFQVVLCKTQSRFTRELELVEKYLHDLFPRWGIRFVGIVDNADTDSRGNKKTRQINGLVNEWYLEDMSENIRSVLTSRRKSGFHIGSFALYGYRKDPDHKGRLLIDEEAAAVVREVFTLFAGGCGKTAIARTLNDRGIPNPTEYKRLHGLRYQQPKGRNSTLWKYPAISAMLTNELYTGTLVQGKYGSVSYKTRQNRPRPRDQWYRVEGTHEAIIDPILWEEVQALVRERARPFAGGSVGLFAGKVRCAGCGYVLRSSVSHGRRYLQCPTHHVAKDACPGAFLSVEKLEKLVLGELERLTAEYLDQEALSKRLTACGAARLKTLPARLEACEKQVEEHGAAVAALYLDQARGSLSQEDFLAAKQALLQEKSRLEAQAERIRRQLAEQDAPDVRELLERSLHPDHLTREMVLCFVDRITVGKRQPGAPLPPVVIHWRF